MKKYIFVFFVLLLLLYSCDFLTPKESKEQTESPERLFNLANEAMIKGENNIAIELYYKIVEQYPEFKKYRADALYRLGVLLFKSERFEEAEKVFQQLITKYKNHQRIKNVYEKLLYIYIQELPDSNKADKIKTIYKSKFKNTDKIEEIERTSVLLNIKEEKSDLIFLSPSEIEVKKIEKIQNYDKEFFPLTSILELKVFSPDRKYIVERKKENNTYFLFLTDIKNNKTKKINGSKNGFGQQWSWDSKYIVFTVMNWATKERTIKLYNIKDNSMKTLFTGKEIGDLLCFSPDNSKIAFWYYNNLWIINRTGKNMSLICKIIKDENIIIMAWEREGNKILVGKKISDKINYYLLYLGRKEFIITK